MRSVLLFCLAIFGSIPLVTSNYCPSNGTWSLDHDSGKCYMVGTIPMSFQNAVQFCKSYGGDLISIENVDEFNYASNVSLKYLMPPWTGAFYNNSADRWYYVNGDYVYSLSYWAQNEPLVGRGDCAVFRSNGGKDIGLAAASCSALQVPLCKYSPTFCGSYVNPTVISKYNGSFTSPNYPDNYFNRLQCYWLIKSPSSKSFISITFDPYMVATPNDYIILYNGNSSSISNQIARYSNPSTQKNSYESTSNQMLVYFYSDSSNTNKGFTAQFKAIADYPDITQTGTSGEMMSANFPNNYDNYLDQTYYIIAPLGTRITAVFDYFVTESRYDILMIYDGSSVNNANLLANLTGTITTSTPVIYHSTNQMMTLRFATDGTVVKTGWHMTWTAN